ncbi:MAG: hypothetical protein HOE90_18435 [Bacteriovoracaceae bacterium]|nr:hypothetical protein [Bacteriovoracaceae bacterium]
MNFDQKRQYLQTKLKEYLEHSLPADSFAEVYKYALFPTGKLLRPLLVNTMACDLGLDPNSSDFVHLALSTEIHHTYTLVHDDLPCMDDDDERRGKPATHKAYGLWQATLAGDGLLNLSYQALSKIKGQNLGALLNYYGWGLGPKGLIQGQVQDLSHLAENGFDQLLSTHILKTGRLFQLCLAGPCIISGKSSVFWSAHRMGRDLGIAFQLLDDLSELSEPNISEHEKEINPFINHPELASAQLCYRIKKLKNCTSRNNWNSLDQFVDYLIAKFKKQINAQNADVLLSHTGTRDALTKVFSLLESINHPN